MAPKESIVKLLQALQNFTSSRLFAQNMKQVKCMELQGGVCTFHLKVEKEHTNVLDTLHSGLAASITDTIAFFAVESHSQFADSSKSGVTSNLHLSYFNPIKCGENILFKAETVSIGERLAFVEISVTNSTATKTYARGSVNISFIS